MSSMDQFVESFGADGVIPRPIAEYAENAYLEYAISVVKGRALPAVTDGMKPVQRRILFAMNEMGLGPSAKPVKSARVVGDVLGKYHPHGDSACYEALVRVAQDFSMRYPLIDGQGNFGSRDGDGAAAMRYTECRLTPIASVLLSEIKQGTIDFKPNYDGAFDEPAVLPARLPMLLLNGASGIAVGMATEIPSHNLREVAQAAVCIIRGESFDLMEVLPGPDFPGGGQVISSPSDIRAAYESGRGSLRVRARWTFEDMARGQWRLIVNELPHGVSCSKVMSELEEVTNPQPKAGKKSLSPEQMQLKASVLSLLDGARDESDKDSAVRLVFEPKSGKVDRQEFVRMLLTHTSLEVSVPMNLVSIGLDGAPRQKSVLQMLSEWVDFRLVTVRRRLERRLEVVNRRLHILEGRKIVFLNMDEVIKVIREAEDPKVSLQERFGLSAEQADDILEIKLRQLARLEWLKIEQEIQRLEEEKAQILVLLSDEKAFRELVVSEVQADAATFGDDRRTLIEVAAPVAAQAAATVSDEPVTVYLSQKGWVRSKSGHGLDASSLAFKDGDALRKAFECRTTDTLVLLLENGRAFSLPCSQVPGGRGDGVPLASLLDVSGSKIVGAFVGSGEERLLFVGSHGYGFTAKLSDLVTRQRAGKVFATVGADEVMLEPVLLAEDDNCVLLHTRQRVLAFWLDEVKYAAKGGKGLQLISMSSDDKLLGVYVTSAGFEIAGTNTKGKKPKEEVLSISASEMDDFVGRRGSRGKALSFDVEQIRVKGAHDREGHSV